MLPSSIPPNFSYPAYPSAGSPRSPWTAGTLQGSIGGHSLQCPQSNAREHLQPCSSCITREHSSPISIQGSTASSAPHHTTREHGHQCSPTTQTKGAQPMVLPKSTREPSQQGSLTPAVQGSTAYSAPQPRRLRRSRGKLWPPDLGLGEVWIPYEVQTSDQKFTPSPGTCCNQV